MPCLIGGEGGIGGGRGERGGVGEKGEIRFKKKSLNSIFCAKQEI